jgi:hypothetical protein
MAVNPTLIALLTAFNIAHQDDAAALRASERAMRHLQTNPVYEFDGVELRITSHSRGHGWVQVTDGIGCSCEGSKHPWCLHRVEHWLMTAWWALTQPVMLRAKIAEQHDPQADIEPTSVAAWTCRRERIIEDRPLALEVRSRADAIRTSAQSQDELEALVNDF